ncbi:hypothetical protein JVT61DRAFT_12310 [Boletus reticuloceps]|uniref:Uncharacterized protein n=1 Tax=Boletus reticuloceps TaxID=495285 RepID=A0A8I3A325_9AGAM|nr:hypothetical protein JVT61DRAFT_12310 [Boletus reticuloceps]
MSQVLGLSGGTVDSNIIHVIFITIPNRPSIRSANFLIRYAQETKHGIISWRNLKRV